MVKTKNCLLTAAAVSAALVAQSAAAFEFHGYTRVGAGTNSEGGDQACFGLPGAGSKYRYGNECENYGELIFNETVYEGDGGSEFGVEIMTRFVGQDAVYDGGNMDVVQSWGYARDVFGGALEGAQFWAGSRYYMRRDVHISDYFYWDTTNAGSGGGVEDIQVGNAKLAYALLTRNDAGMHTNTHDLRLYDLGVNPGGSIMTGVSVTNQSSGDDATDDLAESGFMVTLEHTQDGVLGGFNRLALQYADGSSDLRGVVKTATSEAEADAIADSDGWQVVEQLVWNGDTFSGQGTLVYRDRDFGNGNGDTWISAGVRPMFHVNKYLNLVAELGYDEIDPDEGDSRDLTKLTVGPEITPETGFFSRPAIRAYVTYADWGEEGDLSTAGNTGAASDFANETDGFSYGVQAEAWW